MGSNISNKKNSLFLVDYEDFTHSKLIFDKIYGKIQLKIHKSLKKKISIISHIYENKDIFEKKIIQCKSQLCISHSNILTLLNFEAKIMNNFCCEYYQIIHFYYYFDTTLEEFILRRSCLMKENEIWNIFESLISVIKLYPDNYFDLQPKNILIDEEGK